MELKQIVKTIERQYPKEEAMEWDNVGLLAGRMQKEVKHIYVAVDATDEVIEDARCAEADLLVTHHPLIFGGMKRITDEDFIGRRLVKLLREDIACYAMHTNYDVLRMARLCADLFGLEEQRALEVIREIPEAGIGSIGFLKEAMLLKDCCERVKERFELESVRVFGDLEWSVKKIAICPGSGKSVIDVAISKGADVLLTGDIGHHEGIDAVARGLAVIDAGHYGLESVFIKDMSVWLSEQLPEVTVTGAKRQSPFSVI